ncbi:hypothetical protein LDP04_24375 [Ralstonia pseudosolanacearum]|uniref:hypothetical protein n=1 Tax=Ralstonia pseudosolanacearum TaxID=1310165 RepID=UPI003CF6763A
MHKTVAPISMIPKTITMTISIKTLFFDDVFSENEIISLRRDLFPESFSASVAEWVAGRFSAPSPLDFIFKSFRKKFIEYFDAYEFWLLMGDSVWQSDTKLARHKGLFGKLKLGGADFGSNLERYESVIERDGKIKFFGAIRLEEDVDDLLKFMQPGSCTYIVARDRNSSWPFPISAGWSGEWRQDIDAISSIVGNGGILLRRTGFFDDPEIGLQALGPPEILGKIML